MSYFYVLFVKIVSSKLTAISNHNILIKLNSYNVTGYSEAEVKYSNLNTHTQRFFSKLINVHFGTTIYIYILWEIIVT